MGRWAQAARRGSPTPAAPAGEVPVWANWTGSAGRWVYWWSVSEDALGYEVEVQQWDGSWATIEVLTPAGSARSVLTGALQFEYPTRARARAQWPGGWSEWNAYEEAPGE